VHPQVRAGKVPAVVVANIAKGKDPETGTYPTAEFGLNLVGAHQPYTQVVPDVVPAGTDKDTYFIWLREAWDQHRNRLILIRAKAGHQKQTKPAEEKKV
jgi:hypothetical protein